MTGHQHGRASSAPFDHLASLLLSAMAN
jgi:hypothetical protein